MGEVTGNVVAERFKGTHNAGYLQSRQVPKPGHPHYLALSDLLLALEELAYGATGQWLDYGSGASPYQFLFGDCDYSRADVVGENLDYHIVPGEPLPVAPATFDGILSTQVLEHVPDVEAYLNECWRLLKPDGRLLLSTHGVWKEHGTPHDYWRWTEWGLRRQLKQAGFDVERLARITTGPRAVLTAFLFTQMQNEPLRRAGLLGRLLSFAFGAGRRFKKPIQQLSDTVHATHRVVWDRKEPFYLILLVEARKPRD